MEQQYHAVFRECCAGNCRFRFPDQQSKNPIISCPKCGADAKVVADIDLSADSRSIKEINTEIEFVCLLDNIRSVHNVGALFRTMQGFGVEKAFLCGITPTPDHKNFSKTSMGAENDVCWSYDRNALSRIRSLKDEGYTIISLETCAQSQPITSFSWGDSIKRCVIVIGNEITGIDPAILEMSDHTLSIPIIGRNKSYNVTVAFGIGLFVCFFGA